MSVVAALEDGGLEVLARAGLQRLRGVPGSGERVTSMDMDIRLIVTGETESVWSVVVSPLSRVSRV